MTASTRATALRKRLNGPFKLAISLALMALLLRAVHWREIFAVLTHIHAGWFALALLLFQLGVLVRAARWQILLRAGGVPAPLALLVRWYFIGSLFNTVLPTGFGGDAVKTVALGRYAGRPGVVLGSVLLDRFSGMAMQMPIGIMALLLAPGAASPAVGWLLGLLFGACALIVLLMARRDWALALQRRFPAVARVKAGQILLDAIPTYGLRPLLASFGVSLIFNALLIGLNICLGLAVGAAIPWRYYLIFVPLISVSLVLPSFGGLGVREFSYMALFTQVGVTPAAAAAMGLLFYAVTMGGALVGGILYLTPAAWWKPAPDSRSLGVEQP